IAAFWQYILYVEIILKLREIALPKARNDFALQTRIRNLEDEFSLSDSVVAGDFTARLATAVKQVLSEVEKSEKPSDFKTNITNALFEKPIPKLREAISSFNDIADQIVVLIDDLDKGWPPRRVEPHDISNLAAPSRLSSKRYLRAARS
ncbi:hypothetical protein JZU71_02020, partial [bacterium]|nr:hypothetical protein [bacterium]